MKKLFISCPMKGRTEENIKKSMEKMHKIAEAVFDEELEVIENDIPDHAPKTKHDRIWYLGESVKMMADADYFIGIVGYQFNGCTFERSVAEQYGIKGYTVPARIIADDVATDEACTVCEC